MDYEFKEQSDRQSCEGEAADTRKITQGFTVGVTGAPDSYKMVAGATVVLTVTGVAAKTQAAIDTEVQDAIDAYVTENYPTT